MRGNLKSIIGMVMALCMIMAMMPQTAPPVYADTDGVPSQVSYTGDLKVGSLLTAVVTPENLTGLTYSWHSADAPGGSSSLHTEDVGSTLRLKTRHQGKYIKLAVEKGGIFWESDAFGPVAPADTDLIFDQPAYTCPEATVGYTYVPDTRITYINTTNSPLTGIQATLGGTHADSFELSNLYGFLSVDGTHTLTVKPKMGLAEGTYKATLSLSHASATTTSAEVSFTVKPAGPMEIYSYDFSPVNVDGGANLTGTITVKRMSDGGPAAALPVILSYRTYGGDATKTDTGQIYLGTTDGAGAVSLKGNVAGNNYLYRNIELSCNNYATSEVVTYGSTPEPFLAYGSYSSSPVSWEDAKALGEANGGRLPLVTSFAGIHASEVEGFGEVDSDSWPDKLSSAFYWTGTESLSTSGAAYTVFSFGGIVAQGTQDMNSYPTWAALLPLPAAPPEIITTTLTEGMKDAFYGVQLEFEGNTPMGWHISGGSLPPGLTITNAAIYGTPTTAGTYSFTVVAANPAGTNSQNFTIIIESKSVKDNGGSGASTATELPAVISGATATTNTEAKVDGAGKASAPVTASQLAEAVKKAEEAAAKTGDIPRVEIKVTGASEAKSVETTVPKAAVQALSSGKVGALTIASPLAAVTFDADALDTIAKGMEASASGSDSGTVAFTAAKVPADALTPAVRQLLGNRPVYEFNVTSNGKAISQFNGNVTVSIPYTPAAGEDPNAIIISYINASGNLEIVTNGRYDAATGRVVFVTDHFSQYAVGYNKISFSDVKDSAWYADAVSFLAAREITTGTAEGIFSPNGKLTRGQFMVMLMKAYGIAPDSNESDNFADAGNTYYTGYLGAAKRLGLSDGVGDNMFAPKQEITRQEMFALTYNVLKSIDRLPGETGERPLAGKADSSSGSTLDNFSDSSQISSWAKSSMETLVKAGIITGSDGTLLPKGNTTRAQMAQVIYQMLTI